jgi:glyoxylase-like metal-dependent hydrolase (beta-lactamase superfamily II)
LIEPPCGSNTYIFDNGKRLIFIDSGFACFKNEMLSIFNDLFPNFDNMEKDLILTHNHMDHAGLVDIFDNIYVSEISYDDFKLENEGKENLRIQNPIHEAYFEIDKIITNYKPPVMDKVKIIGKRNGNNIFSKIGELNFEGLSFEIFEGIAGHADGEIIIVSKEFKLVFTGDIFVNVNGFSKSQDEFNLIAPYLMISVNADSNRAKNSRIEMLNKFQDYLICPGHGLWVYNK